MNVSVDIRALLERRKVGYSLDAPFYLSEEVFALDMEAIFKQHWIHVAVEPDIPEPGDYVTVELAGAATVSVAALGADNASLSLKGLPAGYRLTVGDKMQVGYGGRYAFLEVSETVGADGQGITPVFGVFPHLPAGFAAGLGVTLLLPACKCLVMPGSHNPGTASGPITTGATFKIIQKK